MTTFDPIAAIERDVAAHNAFRRHLAWLVPLVVVAGTLWGLAVGLNISVGLLAPTAATLPVTAAVLISLVAAGSGLFARRTPAAWRWPLASLFVAAAVLWKTLLIRADYARLGVFGSFEHSFAHDASCFALGFAASAAVMAVTLFLHRRLQMAPSLWARALSGVLAASCGLLAQGIFCPYIAMAHVGVAHAGPAVLVVLATAALDRRLIRLWSAQPKKK